MIKIKISFAYIYVSDLTVLTFFSEVYVINMNSISLLEQFPSIYMCVPIHPSAVISTLSLSASLPFHPWGSIFQPLRGNREMMYILYVNVRQCLKIVV